MSDGVHVLDEIAPIEAEWDALVDRARLSPFVRPGWIAAWWSTWGNGQLQLLAQLSAVPQRIPHGALKLS